MKLAAIALHRAFVLACRLHSPETTGRAAADRGPTSATGPSVQHARRRRPVRKNPN